MADDKEINVLIGAGVLPADRELFFGPLTPSDAFVSMPEATTWPDLLVQFEFFPSKGQARKAGWPYRIPDGWTDVTIGKLKRRVCILKITKELPFSEIPE